MQRAIAYRPLPKRTAISMDVRSWSRKIPLAGRCRRGHTSSVRRGAAAALLMAAAQVFHVKDTHASGTVAWTIQSAPCPLYAWSNRGGSS